MKSRLKRLLRHWAIALLPLVMLKMWVDRRILKRFYVIAVTFHDVSRAEKHKFERIVRHLHRHFPFITPEQFDAYTKGAFTLADVSLLVTFDDGFTSSRWMTTEVLEPLGIKGTFFCCSNFVDMNESEARHFVAHNICLDLKTEVQVDPAEFAMSSQELRDLARKGHRIAAHTRSHPNLAGALSAETLKAEIVDSAHALERMAETQIQWFAFPFGGIDFINASAMKVIQSRFRFCFSGIRGFIDRSSHPMALPRQSVTIQDPYLLQLALVYGASNWLHQPKIEKIAAMATPI
jgi:peptidoglycan/xylan/chitin deacetylase (PgdA/CDA1 family)